MSKHLLAPAAVVLALALAACGGDAPSNDSGTAPAATTTAPATDTMAPAAPADTTAPANTMAPADTTAPANTMAPATTN